MTNEQLVTFIKQGGNDELIPILWERIRKIMYIKSDKVYNAMQGRFMQCGVEAWDLKQCCYMAFLKAIEGFKPESEIKFTTYLSYPFKNVVSELLGYRSRKKEPLNDCVSLDAPINDDSDSENINLVDTIPDNAAVNAVMTAETADEYRILHETVNALEGAQSGVINAYFFDHKTLKEIAVNLSVSYEWVRQIKSKALMNLRKSKALHDLYSEELEHEKNLVLQHIRTRPDRYVIFMESLRK